MAGGTLPTAQVPATIWVADDVAGLELGPSNCLRRPRINGFDFAADGTPVVGWTQVEGCGGNAWAGWSERLDGSWHTRPFMPPAGITMGGYEFALGSDDRPYLYSTGFSNEVYRVYRSDLRAQAEGEPSLTNTGEVAGYNQQCVYTRFRLARNGDMPVPHRAMTLGDCGGFGPIRINGAELVRYVNPRAHDFALGPDGTPHVAWVDGAGGVFYVRPGVAPIRVTGVGRFSDDIGLERGPDGTLHLVVRGLDSTADSDRGRLGYLQSTDEGATWTLVDDIDVNPTWGVDLELDATGAPAVVYWAYNQLRYATRASGAWVSTTIALPAWNGADWLVRPRLRYDAAGLPHVAYYDWSAHRVRVMSPAPAGADLPVDIAIDAASSPNPTVAGGRVTYTVAVSNLSARAASGLQVQVTLPPGAQLANSTPMPLSTSGGVVTYRAWQANGSLDGTLGPFTTATITFDLTGLAEGEPAVTVTASANEADPDAANNQAVIRTRVNPPTCALPMAGRTAWWPGDGTSLNYGLGAAYHGTPVGGVSYVPGAVGQAFRFDGASAYVNVPNGYDEYYWPGTSAMSVAAWFSTDVSSAAVQAIASMDDMANAPCCGSPQGYAAWYLYVQDGTVRASMRPTPYGSGGVVLIGTTPIADGEFHHAALVIDTPSLQARLYLDGALEASAPLTSGWAMSNGDFEAEPLVIGGAQVLWGNGYRYFFNGAVDDVALYKRALTAQEIANAADGPSLAACGAVNQAPVAADDAVTTDANTPVAIPAALVLANDTDADGDILQVTGVTGAVDGTVGLDAGEITFTPSAGFAGEASFAYTVDDGRGGNASATVRVTVLPPPPGPNFVAHGSLTWQQDRAFESATHAKVRVRVEASFLRSLMPAGAALNVGDSVANLVSLTLQGSGYTEFATPAFTVLGAVAATDTVTGAASAEFVIPVSAMPVTVSYSRCCRLDGLADGNAAAPFSLRTEIDTTRASQSPRTSVVPRIHAVAGEPVSFVVPSTSFDGFTNTFAFAAPADSGLVVDRPAGMSMTAQGYVQWIPTAEGLHAVQFHIATRDSAGAVISTAPVDLIFDVAPRCTVNCPAVVVTAPQQQDAYLGREIAFDVSVTALNVPGAVTELQHSVLPPGAIVTRVSSGTTSRYQFRWTPFLQFTVDGSPRWGNESVCFLGQAVLPYGEPLTSAGQTCVNLVQATAQLLAVEGVIRDFAASHPDFESPEGDAGSVLVAPMLGDGRKPVFNPAGPVSTIESSASFDQWWRDTPASTATPFTLHLSNALQPDARLFELTSSAFAPHTWSPDAMAALPHSAYFTFEAHGRAPHLPGQVLRFTSADDLWVFVNGQLAIDLGGVHAPASAQLDLDARAADLGLVAGEAFTLDIFYAHRGTHLAALTVQVPEGYEAVAVPVNLPPQVPVLGETVAFEGAPIVRRVFATDPEADPIAFAITGLPPGITATPVVTETPPYLDVTGTPAPGSAGMYDATLTVGDGVNTLTLPWRWVVRPPNQGPIARDDAAMAFPWSQTVIPVLANDSDPEGDSLRIVEVSEPLLGHVSIVDTHVVYSRPPNDEFGTDRFTYTVEDAHGRTATATVTVRLLAPGVNLVARSAPSRYVRADETFVLDVTITNEGSETADGVTATFDAPDLTLIASSAPQQAGQMSIGAIAPGASARLTLTLLAGRIAGSSLRVTAQADAEDWRTLADNTSTTTIDVQPEFCFVPQPGLRGFWDADAGWEAEGPIASYGPPDRRVPSRVGSAFQFTGDLNGAGHFTSSWPLPKAFTVTAWANRDPAASSVAPVVMVTGPASLGFTGARYWLGFEDGYPVLTLFGASEGAGQLRSDTAVAPSTWVHLAATYDGVTARLFVNGVEAAARAIDVDWHEATAGSIGYAAGIGPGGTDAAFTGLVDDVAIYDRALGGDDVRRMIDGSPVCAPSASPSMSVTLTATPNPTRIESVVSLTATVTNTTSDGYLERIVLTAQLDELLTLGSVFPFESAPTRWDLPPLMPGESFVLTGLVGTPELDGHFPVSVTASHGHTSAMAMLLVTAVPPACVGEDGAIAQDCDVNDRPVISSPGDQVSRVDDVVSLAVRATDPDGDPVTFSAIGLPAGLTIDASTGAITGTILDGGSGPHRVTIAATDGRLTGRTSFNWTIPHRLLLSVGRGATVRVNDATCDARAAAQQCVFEFERGAVLAAFADLDPAVGTADFWWSGDPLTAPQAVTRSLRSELLVLKRFTVAVDHPASFYSVEMVGASVPVLAGTYPDFRSSMPEFLACSGSQAWSCEGRAPAYSTVVLEGRDDVFAVFDRFSGACTGAACAITLDGDRAVTMHFRPRDVNVSLQPGSNAVMRLEDLTAGTTTTCATQPECIVPVPYGHRVRVSNVTPGGWQHWQLLSPGETLATDRPAEFTVYFETSVMLRLRSRITVEVSGSEWNGAGPPPMTGAASSSGEDVIFACTPGSPVLCTTTVEAFTSVNMHANGSPSAWTGCTSQSTLQWCRLQATAPLMAVTLRYDPPNTPAGTDVTVVAGGAWPIVDLRFAQVTSPGVTRYDTNTGVLLPPDGYSFGTPPEWYDIHTSAMFTGTATVCISHASGRFVNPSAVRLFHQEGGQWVDRTVSVDPLARRVCGNVTSLSPFALAEPIGIEGRMHGELELQQGSARVDVRFTIAERQLGRERGSLRVTITTPVATKGRGRQDVVNKFWSSHLDAIVFSDDPAFRTGRSKRAPVADSAVFTGRGAWNGASGYRFEARAVDAGEPGRGRDRFALTIYDPAGAVVAAIDGVIDRGNIQSDRLDRRHWR